MTVGTMCCLEELPRAELAGASRRVGALVLVWLQEIFLVSHFGRLHWSLLLHYIVQ